MMTYELIEKFVSIDGEGPLAGELAVFIRFAGCNLRCSWCDTCYSWDQSVAVETLSAKEIYDYIKASGVHHVTLTGGEPLVQEQIKELLNILVEDEELMIHIETNGAVAIREFVETYPVDHLRYIVDFKLPESKMTDAMILDNLKVVRPVDVYKFVIASLEDLKKAHEIIEEYDLSKRTKVYLSPVIGKIEPKEIVEYMKANRLEGVKLQLQLHKFIWPKEARGV